MGMGFSHHRVPSLSNTAIRSSLEMWFGPSPVTDSTNSTMACRVSVSFQEGSGLALSSTLMSIVIPFAVCLPLSHELKQRHSAAEQQSTLPSGATAREYLRVGWP